jgi:hypothetical protein
MPAEDKRNGVSFETTRPRLSSVERNMPRARVLWLRAVASAMPAVLIFSACAPRDSGTVSSSSPSGRSANDCGALPAGPPRRVSYVEGDEISPGYLPPGFHLAEGDEANLYAGTLIYRLGDEPNVRIQVSRQFSNKSLDASGYSEGSSVKHISIHGLDAQLRVFPHGVGIYWKERPNVILAVVSFTVGREEVERFAEGLSYDPGREVVVEPDADLGPVVSKENVLEKFRSSKKIDSAAAKLMAYGEWVQVAETPGPDGSPPASGGMSSGPPAGLTYGTPIWVVVLCGDIPPPLSQPYGPPRGDQRWSWALNMFDARTGESVGAYMQGEGNLPAYLAELPDRSAN